MKSPIPLSLLIILLFAGCATTSDQPPTGRFSREAFQYAFSFPDRFFFIPKGSVTDFEKDQPGLGYSVGYSDIGVTLTFYVYDMGETNIPEGTDSGIVQDAFMNAAYEILGAASAGYYELVSIEDGIVIDIGDYPFWFTQADLIMEGRHKDSYIYVTGFNGKILKLRMTIDHEAYEGSDTLRNDIETAIHDEILIPNQAAVTNP